MQQKAPRATPLGAFFGAEMLPNYQEFLEPLPRPRPEPYGPEYRKWTFNPPAGPPRVWPWLFLLAGLGLLWIWM